jgi:hypothetical protein
VLGGPDLRLSVPHNATLSRRFWRSAEAKSYALGFSCFFCPVRTPSDL